MVNPQNEVTSRFRVLTNTQNHQHETQKAERRKNRCVNYDRFYKNYITHKNINSLIFAIPRKLSPTDLKRDRAIINSKLKSDKTYLNFVNTLNQIKMKKFEIEKPKFTIIVDITDYISNSMMIQNNQNILIETDNILLNESPVEDPEDNRTFDLFAHILEG